MNILITGGNGFIAQHLVNSLKDSHTVFAPGRNQLDCLNSNKVNNFFNDHTIDIVIHTALTGRENLFSTDIQYFNDSMTMWNNLYSNRSKFKKLIQFGSAYELDLSRHNNDISLCDVLTQTPNSSYGKAKNEMAKICMTTENFYTLRLFGNLHHTEKDFRFFKKLSTSTHFVINEDRQFDYFNLEDLIMVVKVFIDEPIEIRDLNLVYKDKFSLLEQVTLFCNVNNINPEIVVNSTGFDLTGSSDNLLSLNLKLDGLVKGFEKYSIR
jgi:GDP-L-fucose synthase